MTVTKVKCYNCGVQMKRILLDEYEEVIFQCPTCGDIVPYEDVRDGYYPPEEISGELSWDELFEDD